MQNKRAGIILKKINKYTDEYISLGFYYFDYKDEQCIIQCDDKQIKLPLFDFNYDISVYELNIEKIMESGLYEDVSLLFNELNPKDVYQVFTVSKIDKETYQLFYDYDYTLSIEEKEKYINVFFNPEKHQRVLK